MSQINHAHESLFILTGENSTIPFGELKALINTYSKNAKIIKIEPRVIKVEGKISSSRVIERAGYTRTGGIYLGFLSNLTSNEFRKLEFFKIPKSKTFAVRIYNLTNKKIKSDVVSGLGNSIKNYDSSLKVFLNNPEIIIAGVLIESGLHVFCVDNSILPKYWYNRRPRIRPFFHPSVLYPKFARFLVNLAQIKEGQLLLDPFCGTGSILIEASVMGISSCGGDISRKMCIGSLKNLKYFNIRNSSIINCDIDALPITKIDGLSTDVPYGFTSSRYSRDLESIYESLLDTISSILPMGKFFSIVQPHFLTLPSDKRFVKIQEHDLYIHRGLTRIISVLKKR